MSEGNDAVIAEFRANRGVVTEAMGGHFKNTTLALVHHVGRRTGQERVQPLLCMQNGDNYVLAGSNGGATNEPLWVANLESMPETTIEVGERTLKVKPTVLRSGAERDRLYAAFVAFWPDMLEYETNTDRPFPVVVLEPVA
ncbi:nitroreductase/quinone reductase family protein [Micromonospora sp. NPDC049366]|uniref:nitroreductase/quinone reductase family protein n=1 Tax=Micromonospora sp. NPDC049366 TaxID=3364271 RepID=UPI0037BD1C74